VFFFHGCAKPPAPQKPRLQPFDPSEIRVILEDFRTQQRRVHTCFGTGRLTIRTPEGEDDVKLLVAGQKSPFHVRFEVTHPWGRPLLHLVMSESTLEAVVFPQKRVYRGRPQDVLPTGSLPIPLRPDILWSLVRGFPVVPAHARGGPAKAGQIALFGENDEVRQVITFGSDRALPLCVSFFDPALDVYYGPFDDDDGIRWAPLAKVVHSGSETSLALALKERVFNRSLPSELFQTEVPRGFKVRALSNLKKN
jgi:hypothetical protein